MKLHLSLSVLFIALLISGICKESTSQDTSTVAAPTKSTDSAAASTETTDTEEKTKDVEKEENKVETTTKETKEDANKTEAVTATSTEEIQTDSTTQLPKVKFGERKSSGETKTFRNKNDNNSFIIDFNEPLSNVTLKEPANHHVYHNHGTHNFLNDDDDDKDILRHGNNGKNHLTDGGMKEINDPDFASTRDRTKNVENLGIAEDNAKDRIDYDVGGPPIIPSALLEMYENDVTPVCRDNQYAIHSHNSDVFDVEKANIKASTTAMYTSLKGRFWRLLNVNRNIDRSNPVLARQMDLIVSQVGMGSLKYAQNQALQVARLYLEESYRERYVPNFFNRQQNTFIHKIDNILSHPNTTYQEKLYYWREWHKRTDNLTINMNLVVNQYTTMAAKNQGLKDGAQLLKKPYENPNLQKDITRLWDSVQPLYTLLRKYVQRVLQYKYRHTYKYRGWLLPAHLAGSTSGGDWTYLFEEMKPYPCASAASIQTITNFLEYCSASQSYKISMGMTNTTIDCYSLFDIRSSNYSASDCRPKSYDFCDGISYIMYVCDNRPVDFDFGIEFEKMFYSMEYYNMPLLYRNPHPVIRDAITSLLTTQVFRFGAENRPNEESAINQLMYEALYFLPKIAYAMTITEFSWKKASHQHVRGGWNKLWWDLKYKYEGIDPPEDYYQGEYDPAANYDITMGIDKTSDILSPFLFYQMLRSLCDSSSIRFNNRSAPSCTKGPSRSIFTKRYLYQCSLYGKTAAGTWLQFLQSQGRAMDWRQIVLKTTGKSEINPDALLEYFLPLQDYLYYQDPESQQGLWILLWIVVAVLILIIIVLIVIFLVRWKQRQSETLNHELDNHPTQTSSNNLNNDHGHTNEGFQSVNIEETRN